jgi:hypothetical protein
VVPSFVIVQRALAQEGSLTLVELFLFFFFSLIHFPFICLANTCGLFSLLSDSLALSSRQGTGLPIGHWLILGGGEPGPLFVWVDAETWMQRHATKG